MDSLGIEELKIPRWQHRAGSIPALGTILIDSTHLRLGQYYQYLGQK